MRRWSLKKATSCFGRDAGSHRLSGSWLYIKNEHAFPSKARQTCHAGYRTKSRLEDSKSTVLSEPLKVAVSCAAEADRATRARHLLRSILRECTYLPDSRAREWMTQYTLQRFRRYTFSVWRDQETDDHERRLMAKEREARRWLTYLQSANEGRRKPLYRILLMTYGRTGKRRRELLQPLMVKDDQTAVTAESASQADGQNGGSNEDLWEAVDAGEVSSHRKDTFTAAQSDDLDSSATQKLTPPVTKAMRALILSQTHASPSGSSRTNPRRIDLVLPMYNAWLRPMPQVRIKNKLQKHYAELLSRVHAPLPSADWERLLSLANGHEPVETFIPRRIAAKSLNRGKEHAMRQSALEHVVVFGKLPSRLLQKRRPEAFAPRAMRRMYANVLNQSPQMSWNATTQQWDITWGRQAVQASRHPDDVKQHGNLPPKYDDQSRLNTDKQGPRD